jgi:hypothetical protein
MHMLAATAQEAASARLDEAEQAATQDGRGFVTYGSYWIVVRLVEATGGFAYATSLGHRYGGREDTLSDIAALSSARHIVGCGICKRIRAARDHRSVWCESCVEGLEQRLSDRPAIQAPGKGFFKPDARVDL